MNDPIHYNSSIHCRYLHYHNSSIHYHNSSPGYAPAMLMRTSFHLLAKTLASVKLTTMKAVPVVEVIVSVVQRNRSWAHTYVSFSSPVDLVNVHRDVSSVCGRTARVWTRVHKSTHLNSTFTLWMRRS